MKLGIAGLPNVGKSTLFNALTSAGRAGGELSVLHHRSQHRRGAGAGRAAGCASWDVRPRKGYAGQPSSLWILRGWCAGASRGEGLGNRFLAHIREVDAIVHVLRCFEDSQVAHVDGSVDPLRDRETVELEFILADLETLQRRHDRIQKSVKSGDKTHAQELRVCEKLMAHLEEGKSARTLLLDEEERDVVKTFFLLSQKPMIYACNVSGGGSCGGAHATMRMWRPFFRAAEAEGAKAVVISARIEEELSALDQQERSMFLMSWAFMHPDWTGWLRQAMRC